MQGKMGGVILAMPKSTGVFYGRSFLTFIIWAEHIYMDCLVKEIMIRLRGGAVRFILEVCCSTALE